MNTVLDETKLLCLANGERIRVKDNLKMIFETDDTSYSSPSTISRCGVVYIPEQEVVDHEAIIRTYLNNNL